MAVVWKCSLIVILNLFVVLSEILDCMNNYKCVPLSQCKIDDLEGGFNYPCHSGLNLICCPDGSFNVSLVTSIAHRKTAEFPVNCGADNTDDRISGGKEASLGQFPWMALLGYKQRGVSITQFLCGGSVITEKYIMTAAHCIGLDQRLELVTVRLGEHNILTDIDCTLTNGVRVCADGFIDIGIKRAISHPNYDKNNLHNDIGLIEVHRKIQFTEFISPICLPFERNLENRDLANEKFTVSGWGKTNAANIGGSTTLQYARVNVWDQTECNNSVVPDVRPILGTQLCANGEKTEDACKGDSGGPLVNLTTNREKKATYFQIGIVSFASTLTCGNPKLPTVYTRIDKFLNWIVENIA